MTLSYGGQAIDIDYLNDCKLEEPILFLILAQKREKQMFILLLNMVFISFCSVNFTIFWPISSYHKDEQQFQSLPQTWHLLEFSNSSYCLTHLWQHITSRLLEEFNLDGDWLDVKVASNFCEPAFLLLESTEQADWVVLDYHMISTMPSLENR